MAGNSKEIKVISTAKPATSKKINGLYKKAAIVDPAGQWKYPGEITKIPSNEITMHGVPYPVLGVDNLGNEQMMHPGMNYTFPGQNVTEYPQMQFGASVTGYNQNADYMGDKFKDVGASFNMGKLNLNAGNYFPTKTGTPEKQPNFNPYLQLNYDAGKNRSVGIDAWPGYTGVRFSKTFQDGGEVTPEQAQSFLDDGAIYGHPLTQAQEDYFTSIVEGDTGSTPDDQEEMRYGGRLRKGTTHNVMAGINDLMLRNPHYHTEKHLHFVPFKEEGGSMKNNDDFYVPHQDADRLRSSTPINFVNMPYYGFGGSSDGPLGYFAWGGGDRNKKVVEPNPNYVADSMATVNYAAQHPELYDPNKMQWSTNPTGDALYKQPVVNGKVGRKIPVPFGKNMPEEQTKAIKWSINQMNENNKGEGAPQPYPGLFGVPPVQAYGGEMPCMNCGGQMQQGGVPMLPAVEDPSLAPLKQPSIYDMPLDQVVQQKAFTPINYDMPLDQLKNLKAYKNLGGHMGVFDMGGTPTNYGAFPVMVDGGQHNMIINDLLKKQFGGIPEEEKHATSIDGVVDNKMNFFNSYIRNNVGKALADEMHQEMMGQLQMPSVTKQTGGTTGDDTGVDAFYAQQFPSVYPTAQKQPAPQGYAFSNPQGSFNADGVQTADPYGMMPQVTPYFATQDPNEGHPSIDLPASAFKMDATMQSPTAPQAPKVQNWQMDPNQSRTTQPQPGMKQHNKSHFSMSGIDMANATLGTENRISNMFEAHHNAQQEKANRWRQSGDATFMARPETSSSRGDYDVNSGMFRPNQNIPVQYRGYTAGNAGTNQYFKHGGGFNQNDEVYMSDEDIQQYLAAGGQVEYIE